MTRSRGNEGHGGQRTAAGYPAGVAENVAVKESSRRVDDIDSFILSPVLVLGVCLFRGLS